jgi:cell division protein FtsZ
LIKNIEPKKKYKIIGVGESGCNIVNHMIECRVITAEFVLVCDGDYHLIKPNAYQLIPAFTPFRGLGQVRPDSVRRDTKERQADYERLFADVDKVIIVGGMGGDCGSGAAPVIAGFAKEAGVFVISLVTKPFKFESRMRQTNAEAAIAELKEISDEIIIVALDDLLPDNTKDIIFPQMMKQADNIICKHINNLIKHYSME